VIPSPNRNDRPAGDSLRYVYVRAAGCPKCGSPRVLAYRTNPVEADGSVSRYSRCVACSHRFIVVVSPPASRRFQNLEE
jgi:DNA-directed RNA polymerase subunit RPC12/RpoP